MSNPGVLRLFLFGTALQHRTVGSRVHPGLLRLEEKMLYVVPGIAPKGRRHHDRPPATLQRAWRVGEFRPRAAPVDHAYITSV